MFAVLITIHTSFVCSREYWKSSNCWWFQFPSALKPRQISAHQPLSLIQVQFIMCIPIGSQSPLRLKQTAMYIYRIWKQMRPILPNLPLVYTVIWTGIPIVCDYNPLRVRRSNKPLWPSTNWHVPTNPKLLLDVGFTFCPQNMYMSCNNVWMIQNVCVCEYMFSYVCICIGTCICICISICI